MCFFFLCSREENDAFHRQKLPHGPHWPQVIGAHAVETHQAVHGPPGWIGVQERWREIGKECELNELFELEKQQKSAHPKNCSYVKYFNDSAHKEKRQRRRRTAPSHLRQVGGGGDVHPGLLVREFAFAEELKRLQTKGHKS